MDSLRHYQRRSSYSGPGMLGEVPAPPSHRAPMPPPPMFNTLHHHGFHHSETNSDHTSEREDDSGIESSAPEPQDSTLYIRIGISDTKIQKCLQFHQDDSVWSAKQHILSTIAKDVRDGLNYGLYCPPMNGKAGKFLEEERPLADYPLPGPIGYLEFKYKRRVYKQMQLNPRKLKQLHTKANLRQFFYDVKKGDVDKITKFLNKGLDPNFSDHDTGETPLTYVASQAKPRNLIILLISGGAHIDYRNKRGLTAMHKAAAGGKMDTIQTLLDLGASTNYKDGNGLTPLYHAVISDTNPHCVEVLLHDHAQIGTTDEHGWSEVHQACRIGRVQHLEHLLFYGGDMNSQNSSGNTPLHVAAVNNQESCTRVLLFRGADKTIQNFANQDAFQVAVIAGNIELAEVIKDFKHGDVVPFQELPKYNEKRRATISSSFLSGLTRSRSNPSLNNLSFDSGSRSGSKPPSPILSNRGLHHISTSNLFDRHMGGGYQIGHIYDSDSPRSMSISSAGSVSGSATGSLPGSRMNQDDDTVLINRQTLLALTKNDSEYAPRTVVLQKGRNGFGFVLRGAKDEQIAQGSNNPVLDFKPSKDFPALQYLDRVDKGSAADRAGLKHGDFLIEINNELVVNATHEHTVQLIKSSGETLAMKVVTVPPLSNDGMERELHVDGTRTLPMKKKAPAPFLRDQYANTISRGQSKSVRDSLAELEKLDLALDEFEDPAFSSHLDAMASNKGVDVNNKTASIRSRHSAHKLSAVEILDIEARQDSHDGGHHTIVRTDSYPDGTMGQRSRAMSSPNLLRQNSRDHLSQVDISQAVPAKTFSRRSSSSNSSSTQAEIHYEKHSAASKRPPLTMISYNDKQSHRKTSKSGYPVDNGIPSPPPMRPPSPPEVDDPTLIHISSPQPQYANISEKIQAEKAKESPFESSFRPGMNARLSANPLAGKEGKPQPVNQTPQNDYRSTIPRSAPPRQQTYEEDEPIYDEPAPDYEDLPARLTYSESKVPTQRSYETDVMITPLSRFSRQSKEEEQQENPFANAIKAAAIAREQRQHDEPARADRPAAPPPPPPLLKDPNTPAAPNWNPSPDRLTSPPPAPVMHHQSPQQQPAPPRQMPEHLRKQIEADRQREDSHNQLMAAVARRRNIVDNSDEVANDSIDDRIQRNKNMQSTMYKNDSTVVKLKKEEQRMPVLANNAQHREQEQRQDEVVINDARHGSIERTDFMAEAEKLRQEYLKQKTGTLDRRKDPSSTTSSPSAPVNHVKSAPPPPPPPPPVKPQQDSPSQLRKDPVPKPQEHCQPKPPVQKTSNSDNSNGGAPALGGLAAVIAARAQLRQQNPTDTGGNLSNVTTSHSTTYRHQNTGTKLSNDVVQLQGATTDFSTTEAFGHPQGNSVSSKANMFEQAKKKIAPKPPRRSSHGSVLSAPSHSELSGGLAISHNHNRDTVGWVMNSSPRLDHDAAIRQKLAQQNMHNGAGYDDMNGDVGVMSYMEDLGIDLVPPPPMFEPSPEQFSSHIAHENDNASLVSSLSTLSTLSSNDHHDSSGYSSSRQGFSPVPIPEIAPPPPGFDDMVGSPMGGGFVPPPMGFGASPPREFQPSSSLQHSFKQKKMQDWTNQDVTDWLESMNMSELKMVFIRSAIDGKQLIRMDRNELMEIGVQDVGHRMSIERAIKGAQLDQD